MRRIAPSRHLHAVSRSACLLAVVLLAVAGCSSGGADATSSTSSTSAGSSGASSAPAPAGSSSAAPSGVPRATTVGVAPASIAARCGTNTTITDPLPTPFTFTTADGQTIVAAEFGTGPKGVVALHELGRAGLCGWVAYALRLAAAGLHVLVFDHRCVGLSTCPTDASAGNLLADTAAAREELLRRGATTTALLGASQGGGEAIAAAASQPGWTRAAVLSGALFDLDFGGGVTPTGVVGSLAVPVLFLVNANDPDSPLAADQALVAAAPPGTATLQVVDQTGHGWGLLQSFPGDPFSPLADQVATFLAG